jgi:Arc/MetJ family transcription regulator
MPRTRTNIELDDDLLDRIMRRHEVRTKTEAVDLALRRLAGQPLTWRQIEAMEGARAIGEVPEDRGPRT